MEEQEQVVAPRVTALIVSHNSAEPLRRLLTSLEASENRAELEILVVDKASEDGTAEAADAFPNVTVMRLQRNFGRTKALNIGTRTAKGDYLFLIDPGMEVQPGTIAGLLRIIDGDPGVGAVCPLTVDAAGEPVLAAYRLPTAESLRANWKSDSGGPAAAIALQQGPTEVEFVTNAALLVRREFVRGMNYFDERYGEFGSIAELCFQLRRGGKKIIVAPELRVTQTAAGDWRSQPASDIKAQFSADYALGAAAYVAKREGAMAGLGFRLGAAFHSLVQTLTFRSPGYNAKRLYYLVSGQKIDGTQTAV